MLLATLGRAKILRLCPCFYYNIVSNKSIRSSLPVLFACSFKNFTQIGLQTLQRITHNSFTTLTFSRQPSDSHKHEFPRASLHPALT